MSLITRCQKQYVTFPDMDTLAFWAIIQKFDADEIQIGKQPEATLTQVVNWN